MRKLFYLLCLALLATKASATSHCYLQRTHCFAVDDGDGGVVMYVKRHKFAAAAKEHGLSKKQINDIIKKAEGKEKKPKKEDLRDSRGYYGGVYWNRPLYPYPYHHHGHHHHDHDEHHKPDRPKPDRPTIQPTENPFFNRPDRPQRPIQRPQRPIQKPNRPVQRPINRPIQRPRPRPRPRPMRRPMRRR